MSKSASSASASAASAASAASRSMSTAGAKASAAAADALHYNDGRSTGLTLLMACAIVITVFAVVAGGIYFSGYADDVLVYYAKKFYEAKAKTETAAMEKLGEGKAQDFLKGQLKKNPILGENELENIAPGLGKEASMEGLGGVSKKLGGLGGGIPKF